jgi:hypothetical protein
VIRLGERLAMDIHKPKPWHGVREFLKEYVIIVVGVLTALGAEQTVEWLHTQKELSETREALHDEVSANAASIRFALQEDRCYLAAMDLYAAWARGGPKPPPIMEAVHFPGFRASVWDEVKSGAVLHMPMEERLAYARFYGDGVNLLTLVEQDRALAGEITHATAAGDLDREDAKALLRAVSVKNFLRIKIQTGTGMLQEAVTLGAKPKPRGAEARGYLSTLCGMVGVPVTD